MPGSGNNGAFCGRMDDSFGEGLSALGIAGDSTGLGRPEPPSRRTRTAADRLLRRSDRM